MIVKIAIVCGLVWSLSGCAEKVAERSGSSVDIVPLTYSLSLNITTANKTQSERKITDFIHRHWLQLKHQDVNIEVGSNIATTIASNTQSTLIKNGISPDAIFVHKQIDSPDFAFNFTLSFQVHHVSTEACDYSRIGDYGEINLGCYVDSARWHSMVHPEKMIAK